MINWVVMDKAAGMLADIALGTEISDSEPASQVFHLINPKTTTWPALVPTTQKFFRQTSDAELGIVDYDTWLDDLQSLDMNDQRERGAFSGTEVTRFLRWTSYQKGC